MTASHPDRLDDARAAAALDRFLDTGATAAVPTADVELTTAAQRINAVAAQTVPNDIVAAERRRIWEDIMATRRPAATVGIPSPAPSSAQPTLVAPLPRRGQPAGRQWSSRLQFAVAATLILGLFASLVSLRPPDGTGGPTSNGVAGVASPDDTSEIERGHLSYTVPSIPAGDPMGTLTRYSMAPASTLTLFFSDIVPTTVGAYVAEGTALFVFQDAAPVQITGGTEQESFGTLSGTGLLTIAPVDVGVVLYLSVVGAFPPENLPAGTAFRGIVIPEDIGTLESGNLASRSVTQDTPLLISLRLVQLDDASSTLGVAGNPLMSVITPVEGPILVEAEAGTPFRFGSTGANEPARDPDLAAPEVIRPGTTTVLRDGDAVTAGWADASATALIATISGGEPPTAAEQTAAIEAYTPAPTPDYRDAFDGPPFPSTPEPSEDQHILPYDLTVRVDRPGLVRGDPGAIAAAEASIREQLDPFALANCTFRMVQAEGSPGWDNTLGDGQLLADHAIALIQAMYPDAAADAFTYRSARMLGIDGDVVIRLHLNDGCTLPSATSSSDEVRDTEGESTQEAGTSTTPGMGPIVPLDATPIRLTFQVDADGLASLDPVAIAEAEAVIHDAVGPYADAGCVFGVLLVEGHSGAAGTIAEGNALSDTVVEIITTRYPVAADRAFVYTVANLSEPKGQVTLQLLPYQGCTLPVGASSSDRVPDTGVEATPETGPPTTPGPGAIVPLDQTTIDLTFRVDADGLAVQDPVAIAEAEATIREVIGPYADAGCRFGAMIVEGNSGADGTIGEGNALSDTVVDIITALYPEAADRPFVYSAANLSDPEGQITLQLLVYEGCARPSLATPMA